MSISHAHGPIDVHAHWYPQSFLDLVSAHGAPFGVEWRDTDRGPQFRIGHLTTGPVGLRFVDLDTRLAEMDGQSVQVHALSLSQPLIYWADRALAERLQITCNDALARAHEHAPGRLVGLATLAVHEPDLAVREVERAAKLPGVRGFYMATEVNGRNLSHESLLPVYEAVAATGMPLFLHPIFVIGHERLEQFYLTNLLGNPFESAIAAAHLVFSGVLDRFPALDVVLPHAGGAFPWLVGRLDRGWQKRAELKHVRHSPVEYLRRFHYDTIGYSDAVVEYLVRQVGADRVLMGSDYCFPIAYEQPVKVVTDHPALTDADKHAITATNARRLLRL
jgi:aminocarboxymuconate-semialdehyde decarboxylase